MTRKRSEQDRPRASVVKLATSFLRDARESGDDAYLLEIWANQIEQAIRTAVRAAQTRARRRVARAEQITTACVAAQERAERRLYEIQRGTARRT